MTQITFTISPTRRFRPRTGPSVPRRATVPTRRALIPRDPSGFLIRAGRVGAGGRRRRSRCDPASPPRKLDSGDVRSSTSRSRSSTCRPRSTPRPSASVRCTARWRTGALVGGHERDHVRASRRARLRRDQGAEFQLSRGDRQPEAFRSTAVAFEDLAAAAYKEQAPQIKSRSYLAAALAIHSVEARHAAWIRRLAGVLPAAKRSTSRSGQQGVEIVNSTHFVSLETPDTSARVARGSRGSGWLASAWARGGGSCWRWPGCAISAGAAAELISRTAVDARRRASSVPCRSPPAAGRALRRRSTSRLVRSVRSPRRHALGAGAAGDGRPPRAEREQAPAGVGRRRGRRRGTTNIVVADGEAVRRGVLWDGSLTSFPTARKGWVPRNARSAAWSFVAHPSCGQSAADSGVAVRSGRVIFHAPVGVGGRRDADAGRTVLYSRSIERLQESDVRTAGIWHERAVTDAD